MLSALRTAGCTTVLASRAFVEKGGLGELVEAVQAAGFDLLWTEDLRAAVTGFDKLAALVAARFSPRDLRRETEAVVLFTSGTEGAPKGVVLTHGNLLANVAQLQARAPIGPTDRAVSALPLFHSFGLTAGIVLMLVTGIRTGLHPSPLHYRVIPELVKKLQATILIGTDTFLTGWGRRATAEHFASLRAVVAGAEPVKADDARGLVRALRGDDPRRLRRDRDRPGAGAERPRRSADRHGRPAASRDRASAGAGGRGGWRPAAGARAERHGRLPPPEGGGRIEPPEDGWYDTGDIVRIGEEGHVTIVGRAKRFAKVGGEMVSLAAVEALAAEVWPGEPLGAAALPCPRKGQKVVLAIANPAAGLDALRAHAREAGVAEIQLPSELRILAEIPVMASGKTDFPRLQALLEADPG